VNTNVAALIARNTFFDANEPLNVSFERLSSGLRINSAADDAAGLQVTTYFTSQTDGLVQSVRNANDAISLTQVAALIIEISRIGSDTSFAGVPLLSGDYSSTLQIGAFAGQTLSVNFSRQGGFGASGIAVGSIDVTTLNTASAAITAIDSAISAIAQERADIGALTNRFQSTIRNLLDVQSNPESAKSRILDADFSKEATELARNQIIQQATVAVLSQANSAPQAALQLLL
jgi:flagellin